MAKARHRHQKSNAGSPWSRRAEQPLRGVRRPPRLTHTRQGRPTKHAPSEHRRQGWRASRSTTNRHHGLVKHSHWARQNRHQGIIRSRLRDPNIEISSTAAISTIPLITLKGVHLCSSRSNLRSGSSEYPSRYTTRFESTWLQNSAEYTRGYLALSSA